MCSLDSRSVTVRPPFASQQRSVQHRLGGSLTHTEGVGYLGMGVATPVPQHHRGAALGVKGAQRGNQIWPGPISPAARRPVGLRSGSVTPLDLAPALGSTASVHHASAQVPARVVELVPPLEHLGESVLGDLLGQRLRPLSNQASRTMATRSAEKSRSKPSGPSGPEPPGASRTTGSTALMPSESSSAANIITPTIPHPAVSFPISQRRTVQPRLLARRQLGTPGSAGGRRCVAGGCRPRRGL